MYEVVVATTTRYEHPDDLRVRLACAMLATARAAGVPVVVVDESSDAVHDVLLAAGGRIVRPPHPLTRGSSRRYALRLAGETAGDLPRSATVWMEPEKEPLIRQLRSLCGPIVAGEADLVIPERTAEGLRSYPPVQAALECAGNAIFEHLTGRFLDLWFGPRAMNATARQYFLAYAGEYGDAWEAIFIPVLRAIHDGLRVRSLPVSYQHPSEQTAAEDDVATGIVKRLQQLRTIATALCAEAQCLAMVPRTSGG